MKKEERIDAIQFRKDGSAIVADAAVTIQGRYWQKARDFPEGAGRRRKR